MYTHTAYIHNYALTYYHIQKHTCAKTYIRNMLCLTLVIAEVPGVLEDLEPRPCGQTLLPFGRQVWTLPGEETALYRVYIRVLN